MIMRIFILEHIFVRSMTFCVATMTTATTTAAISVLAATITTLALILIPLTMLARLLCFVFEKPELEVPPILHDKYVAYGGA